MKVKITCPKCRSSNVSIASMGKLEDPTPLYKCGNCGYKHRLFPQMWKEKTGEEADEE
mgnify:FL=1